MRLICFGSARLEGYVGTKISSQLLLLLSYMRLEQESSKLRLAQVFWPHLSNDFSKKGERKDLNNTAVALASLKRELGLVPEELTTLQCDAVSLELAFIQGNYLEVTKIYQGKDFLAEIEASQRLHMSEALELWLLKQRERFKDMTLRALLSLAETNLSAHPEASRKYAAQAYSLARSKPKACYLDKLFELLTKLEHPLLEELKDRLSSFFDDLASDGLSQEAVKLILLLSLQEKQNLAAAQVAANLSPKRLSYALNELMDASLINETYDLLIPQICQLYLATRPALYLDLLGLLRDNTPSEEAFGIFQKLYHCSQSFGGLGYWQKARDSYLNHAHSLNDAGKLEDIVSVLKEFHEAEKANQKSPDPEIHLLYINSLGILTRYHELTALLEPLDDSPPLLAVKAAAYHRLGQTEKSLTAAEAALASADTNDHWTLTVASNNLGILYEKLNQTHEAEKWLAKAELHAHLGTRPELAMMIAISRARLLKRLGRLEESRELLHQFVLKAADFPKAKAMALSSLGEHYAWLEHYQNYQTAEPYFRQAVEVSKNAGFDKRFPGFYSVHLNDWTYAAWNSKSISAKEAETQFLEVMTIAGEREDRKIYARAQANLAIVHQDLSSFEAALQMMYEMKNYFELDAFLPDFKTLLEQKIHQANDESDQQAVAYYQSKHQFIAQLGRRETSRIAS